MRIGRNKLLSIPNENLANGNRIVWEAMPGAQSLFLSCPVPEVLGEGNRGGGKTDTLLMDFAQFVGIGLKSDWTGVIFRMEYKELGDVVKKSKKWFPQIFPNAKFLASSSDLKWVFPDGEQLLFRTGKTVEDYWNFHGHEYPWIAFEELTNWPDDGLYKRMWSCNRCSNKHAPLRRRNTCNPYGVGHNWVKHRFQLPQMRHKVIRGEYDEELDMHMPDRVSIPIMLKDNKALLEADPNYLGKILAAARNDAEKKAWQSGDWDITAGGMFDDVWNPTYHVIDPFQIPAGWRIDRSFDWGASKPFSVGWWAQSDGSDIVYANGTVLNTVRGDLFRISEWYGWSGEPNVGVRMQAKDIARGIIEREQVMKPRLFPYSRVNPGPADTSIWNDDEGKGSIASDMASLRVRWSKADKSAGSRIQGWEQVRKYLKQAVPEDGMPREAPGLFIFRTCDQFLRTIPTLPRSNHNLDDVDTMAEDHIADELRYRVRRRSTKIRQKGW